jgi:regulator of protease activity HflC (stomatin/prohibitin superfamily)
MTKKYVYIDTKTQELNIETMAYSSDAQVMNIAMTVQYQALGDKAMDIVKEYGSLEALTSRITSIVTETPKSVVSTRTAMDIIANRGAITPEVEAAIVAAIGDQYYVAINKVTITNIDFSDAFEQAVEEKMVAEQAKLKADYENEKKLAQAEADAKAKIMAAEAEKQANELLEKSLTDKILQEMYLDKWDGKLPQVVTDGNTIMQIPALAQ